MQTNLLTVTIVIAVIALTSCVSQDKNAEDIGFQLAAPKTKSKTDSWIFEPQKYPGSSRGHAIGKKSSWQTQVTKLPMAVEKLSDAAVVELTDELATYYAGPHYKRQVGTRPYLVRAVFWNYTGDFDLYWNDEALYVHQSSLGGIYGETKLPIVVNLKQPPKAVYVYMSSAL
jgi:hypothetical protein